MQTNDPGERLEADQGDRDDGQEKDEKGEVYQTR